MSDFLYNGSKLLSMGLNTFFYYKEDKDMEAFNDFLKNDKSKRDKKPVPSVLDSKNDEKAKDDDSDRIICCLCLTNIRSVVFQPCRHSLTCNTCAIKLKENYSPCPICRTDIQKFVIFQLS